MYNPLGNWSGWYFSEEVKLWLKLKMFILEI
jgi:hypothetical protein